MTPRTKARGFSQQQSDEILSTLAPLTEEQRELAFATRFLIFPSVMSGLRKASTIFQILWSIESD